MATQNRPENTDKNAQEITLSQPPKKSGKKRNRPLNN